MAQQYAKQQPQGFKNHFSKIAIVGGGGSVGKYIVAELLKTGKHTVTAITREDSTSSLQEGVIAAKVNYDDHSSLVKALQGQEFLIITMGVMAPKDTQSKLIKAAAEAGIKWVMPNEWGYDKANPSLIKDITLGSVAKDACDEIERLGMSWIGFVCSFWYEFSLGGGTVRYGFDFKDRQVIFFDDGNTPINTSTWPQCGRGVASLLSLKVFPDDENDKSTTLSQFRNDLCRISSFLVSQKDMFESVKRVTGTTDKDWKISSEPSEERYQKGKQAMFGGDMSGFAIQMYTRVFFQNGDGNYEKSHGLANEALGLPKEDLDEYTKKAIKFSNQEYS